MPIQDTTTSSNCIFLLFHTSPQPAPKLKMQEPQKDYYGLLDIAPDASEIVIKKAYKRLALRYHPDKNSEDANAQENFQIVLSLLLLSMLRGIFNFE